jgi:methylenetetrahydromethanopterin dehydrogenase
LVRIGFLKLGNIATAPMIELLLDERAERGDIEVRVVTTGANMSPAQAEEAANTLLNLKPQIVFITSPNASTPGPTKAREVLSGRVPVVVVSDGPRKLAEELAKKGMGCIIVEADSMIGARREFLDPVEMALFNSDTIRVLAVTGAYTVLCKTLDDLVLTLKEGKELKLPSLVVDSSLATEAASFKNPYAKAKAYAAYEVARRVSAITTEACFRVKEWEVYTAMCAAAHEMMRTAAELADAAREIEKYGDSVLRMPHYDDGSTLVKRSLIEKPRKS